MRQSQPVLQGHDKERSKSSRFRGVWRKSDRKWCAEIRDRDGNRHWLGTHSTEEEAALAYDRGAIGYDRTDVKLNFPKSSEEMLEREFKINGKKPRSKRRPAKPCTWTPFPAKPDSPSSSERLPPKRSLAQPDSPSSTERSPTKRRTGNSGLHFSSKIRPPIPHPAQLDLPSSSERPAAELRPAVGRAREADRERKTSSSPLLQEKLNQFVAPLLMMLTMFVNDLMQNQPGTVSELVKVFITCISRINCLAFYKSQWESALLAVNYLQKCQHEFAGAFWSITKHKLETLERKEDLKRARSKSHPANPDLPSISTAVVSGEQTSDSESSIETREAFREGKNLSSSWLRGKLTQVLAPFRMRLHVFVDDPMQESAGAILNELVKTFINCISHAQSLAQQFDMAQRESGLEAINSKRESWHKFAVELSSIMLHQLSELYPSLQQTSQGNSINQPPVVMRHSFIPQQTNDVNMGSITHDLVARQEEQDDLEIGAIEALLSLISTSQEGKNRSKIEE